MLFSDEETAKLMGELYECAWEMVRPVPRVEIDFGDGRKLTRTLQGNVATCLCTPDGRTLDIIPGVCGAEEYRRRLRAGAALAESAKSARGRLERLVADYHRELAKGVSAERIAELRNYVDRTKSGVEGRIKEALAASLEAAMPARRIPDAGKRMAEEPLKDALKDDTKYNVEVRMPKVHALLAEKPLAKPSELKVGLFRDILGYDIEDPYLGLAPVVLGGEGGRHD